jgi:uncharacterized protein (DUF169 family)
MFALNEYHDYAEELERLLLLRTSPIAVKMLEKAEDIPEGALRPLKDRGIHIAQCQAFALSRRDRLSVAMLKEDSWCPAPISGYGMVTPREYDGGFPHFVEKAEAAQNLAQTSPEFEYGKYAGIVTAPLKTANFIPDVVLVYGNVAQLRSLLFAVKYKEGSLVKSEFDPLRSCIFSIVPVMQTGEYRITVPDSGEHLRAMSGEDEIIFSAPAGKIATLVSGLKHFDETKTGYRQLRFEMHPDFPQPEHYLKIFKTWGLAAGE